MPLRSSPVAPSLVSMGLSALPPGFGFAALPVKLDIDAVVAFAAVGVGAAVGQTGDERGLGGYGGRRQAMRTMGMGLGVATCRFCNMDGAELVYREYSTLSKNLRTFSCWP